MDEGIRLRPCRESRRSPSIVSLAGLIEIRSAHRSSREKSRDYLAFERHVPPRLRSGRPVIGVISISANPVGLNGFRPVPFVPSGVEAPISPVCGAGRGSYSRAMSRPRIGISLGDPSGISIEVTLKALALPKVKRALIPVLFGDASVKAGAHELRVVSQLAAALARESANGPFPFAKDNSCRPSNTCGPIACARC